MSLPAVTDLKNSLRVCSMTQRKRWGTYKIWIKSMSTESRLVDRLLKDPRTFDTFVIAKVCTRNLNSCKFCAVFSKRKVAVPVF